MGKYLKSFNEDAEYKQFKESEDYILPNVSYVESDNVVYYNPYAKAALSYTAVDLGLPSGLKWADRNVGASSSEDAGLYFAWGETVGYTADQVGKDKVFDWANYWDSVNGSSTDFNKYATDKLTVLEASDDAATVNMGYDWRMPTHAELTELINNTNKILIDKNGNEVSKTTSGNLKGIKLVSKTNGNSIFIPTSAYATDSSLIGLGDGGGLWSSSMHSYSSYSARCLSFIYLGSVGAEATSRVYGYPVRGVHA